MFSVLIRRVFISQQVSIRTLSRRGRRSSNEPFVSSSSPLASLSPRQADLTSSPSVSLPLSLYQQPRRLAALLERHEFSANTNHLVPVEHNSNSRGRGGRGGGGGGGGGRGRGGGGERGRGSNKSSRGHQNQARVRGHDKKMRNGGGSGGGAPPASAI